MTTDILFPSWEAGEMQGRTRWTVILLLWFFGSHALIGAPIPFPRKVNTQSSRLQLLDSNEISRAERRHWHPAELVAILGDQRCRHWAKLWHISYSSDGKQLATSAGGNVYIWDVASRKVKDSLSVQTDFVQFSSTGNGLLTSGEGATVRRWDTSASKLKSRVLLKNAFGAYALHNIAMSKDGGKLVAATSSFAKQHYSVDIYDLNALTPARSTLPLEEGQSFCVADFSSDSRVLAVLMCKIESYDKWKSRQYDEKVILWDVSGPQPKRYAVLNGASRPWGVLAFSPNGKRIICGGDMWDLSKTKPQFCGAFVEKGEEVWGCVFLPDGQSAITTSIKDQRLHVRVWDMRERIPQLRQTVRLSSRYCHGIALAPDAKSVAIGEDNYLHIWRIEDGKLEVKPSSHGHTSPVTQLSFGACGNLLATGGDDTLRLWDLDGPRPRQRFVLKNEEAFWDSVALSPDGSKLAAGCKKNNLTVWNVAPAGLRRRAEHKVGAEALAFTPDSSTLFAVDNSHPVMTLDMSCPNEPPVELATKKVVEGLYANTVAISPDGETAAFGVYHQVDLWERAERSWRKRTDFSPYTFYMHRSLAFTPRGKSLLLGGGNGNGTLDLFYVRGEKPEKFDPTLKRDKPITAVAASSNGLFLAAADEAGRVTVWSAKMEKKLYDWTFPGPVRSLAFAPDGRHLALGNSDGTVYILRLTVPAPK